MIEIKSPPVNPRIALALSGGGFRASIFHLGLLRRLAELGWLKRVDAISTVSGGSIVGAFAVTRWERWLAEGADAAAFERLITIPFLERVQHRNFLLEWLCSAPLWPFHKFWRRGFTRTDSAVQLMDRWFFSGISCEELPETPLLIINATSLQSIRAWRFTRHGLGDSRIGYSRWNGHALPLSVAVCASASFPPLFPPIRIKQAHYRFSGPVYNELALTPSEFIALTDGGAYDNSGMEALLKSTELPGPHRLLPAEFVIVSDGGGLTAHKFRGSGIPAATEALLLYRVDQIAREQATALRTRLLVGQFLSGERQGLMISLRSATNRIPTDRFAEYCRTVPEILHVPSDLLDQIHSIRTSLDRFTDTESCALMYHAYMLTDCFAWCYRDTFSREYRVAATPSPAWNLEFTPEVKAQWKASLRDSKSTLRLR